MINVETLEAATEWKADSWPRRCTGTPVAAAVVGTRSLAAV